MHNYATQGATSTMRLRRKLLIFAVFLLVVPPLGCVGWLLWYSIYPTFPVPPEAINYHSEPRFGGPDHQDDLNSFDLPAPQETIVAFYRQQWAGCTEQGYCSGKTLLGRGEYEILEIRRISTTLTHVEAYMYWSSF
jgi:hypothetical protein